MTTPHLEWLAEFLTIDREPMLMSPVHHAGTGRANIPASTVTKWLWSWVAPAILLAVGMLVFQAGVFVGRGPYEALDQRITHHEMMDHYSADVLDIKFADQTRRLERIERLIEARGP